MPDKYCTTMSDCPYYSDSSDLRLENERLRGLLYRIKSQYDQQAMLIIPELEDGRFRV